MRYALILCILLSLLMLSCKKIERKVPDTGHINYIRDARTGLCFAYHQAYSRFGLAHVPCDALTNVPVKDCYLTETQ